MIVLECVFFGYCIESYTPCMNDSMRILDLYYYLAEKYVIERAVAKNICTHILLYSLQVNRMARSSKTHGYATRRRRD